MIIRALTGERGFFSGGSMANRLGFARYAIGAISLFTGAAILIVGFARAL
jgi:hypothetical protein